MFCPIYWLNFEEIDAFLEIEWSVEVKRTVCPVGPLVCNLSAAVVIASAPFLACLESTLFQILKH